MKPLDLSDLTLSIVEPSVVQAKVIINYLNRFSVTKVQYYTNGSDALDSARRFPPDLVLSAMYLPDMTGKDLVLAIRSDRQLENTPFVLVSSETSIRELDPIRQAGVVAILPKPFELHQLRQALTATLDILALEEEALADYSLEHINVLVVDDSSMSRKQIYRVVSHLGIENVDFAENGKEAVALLAKRFYDLIITDYNMPEMDGEELVRYVRHSSACSSIPILAVTSEANESKLASIQKAGISEIFDKPFEPATLKAAILRLLSEMMEEDTHLS